MSALREDPPHVLRPPGEHYAIADKLLHDVEGADMSLPFVRYKVARAQVHAMLAQCFSHDEPVDEASFYYDDNTYRAPVITTVTTTEDRL